MPKHQSLRDQRMRQRLTIEAARIMADEGVRDYYMAKRKAASRLGAPDTHNMPRNREIQEALSEYQRIFHSDSQPARLRELREAAAQAMEFLAHFRPRLVGSVLDGTAGEYSDVNLHVFADTPEELAFFLMDHRIPFDTSERKLKVMRDTYQSFPVYSFLAEDVVIDLTVFSGKDSNQFPRSQIDGQPMERLNLKGVQALLEERPC